METFLTLALQCVNNAKGTSGAGVKTCVIQYELVGTRCPFFIGYCLNHSYKHEFLTFRRVVYLLGKLRYIQVIRAKVHSEWEKK